MKRQVSGHRGVTLIEMFLAVSLLSLVIGVMFYIFAVASTTWSKSRELIEVKESAQIVLTRIEREIRGSAIDSVTIDPNYPDHGNNSISFLSAVNPTTGRTDFNNKGEMWWRKYVLFYLKHDQNASGSVTYNKYYQLYSREISLGQFSSSGTTGYDTDPITELLYQPLWSTPDIPGNKHDNDFYITQSAGTYISAEHPVIKNITQLQFVSVPPRIEIHVITGKPLIPEDPNSPPGPDKMEFTSVVVLRNR